MELRGEQRAMALTIVDYLLDAVCDEYVLLLKAPISADPAKVVVDTILADDDKLRSVVREALQRNLGKEPSALQVRRGAERVQRHLRVVDYFVPTHEDGHRVRNASNASFEIRRGPTEKTCSNIDSVKAAGKLGLNWLRTCCRNPLVECRESSCEYHRRREAIGDRHLISTHKVLGIMGRPRENATAVVIDGFPLSSFAEHRYLYLPIDTELAEALREEGLLEEIQDDVAEYRRVFKRDAARARRNRIQRRANWTPPTKHFAVMYQVTWALHLVPKLVAQGQDTETIIRALVSRLEDGGVFGGDLHDLPTSIPEQAFLKMGFRLGPALAQFSRLLARAFADRSAAKWLPIRFSANEGKAEVIAFATMPAIDFGERPVICLDPTADGVVWDALIEREVDLVQWDRRSELTIYQYQDAEYPKLTLVYDFPKWLKAELKARVAVPGTTVLITFRDLLKSKVVQALSRAAEDAGGELVVRHYRDPKPVRVGDLHQAIFLGGPRIPDHDRETAAKLLFEEKWTDPEVQRRVQRTLESSVLYQAIDQISAVAGSQAEFYVYTSMDLSSYPDLVIEELTCLKTKFTAKDWVFAYHDFLIRKFGVSAAVLAKEFFDGGDGTIGRAGNPHSYFAAIEKNLEDSGFIPQGPLLLLIKGVRGINSSTAFGPVLDYLSPPRISSSAVRHNSKLWITERAGLATAKLKGGGKGKPLTLYGRLDSLRTALSRLGKELSETVVLEIVEPSSDPEQSGTACPL